MKITTLSGVILIGIISLIWIAKIVLDIYLKTYLESGSEFVFGLLLGVIWIGVFIYALKGYIAYKKEH